MRAEPYPNTDVSVPAIMFRADSSCSLAIVRSLGRMGVNVYCIDPDDSAIAFRSRYCAGRYKWDFDKNSAEDSVKFLLDVAAEVGGRPVLLPTFDESNLFVDKCRQDLSKAYRLPQPRVGQMDRLYSKETLYDICLETAVPTPRTLFPHSLEEALNDLATLRFPVVIKGIDPERLLRYTGGLRITFVHKEEDFADAYRSFDEPGTRNIAVQEFVAGGPRNSWGIAAYFDTQGECRFALTARKLRELPITGGTSTFVETAAGEDMLESLQKIINATGYRGLADVDFCFDPQDGEYKLLDFNPRMGANFRAFVDQQQLDSVRALYLDLTDQRVPAVVPEWGRAWLIEETDLISTIKLLRNGSLSISDWWKSVRQTSEFAFCDSRDMRPALALFPRLFNRVFKAYSKRAGLSRA